MFSTNYSAMDDKLQTYFDSIITKCEVQCKWSCEGHYYMYKHMINNLIYMILTKVKCELCSWSDELVHADTMKATFGCSYVHIQIH